MAFIKRTQSESHEVVQDEERDAIRRVAGDKSAQNLAEAEKDRLLRELEAAQKQ